MHPKAKTQEGIIKSWHMMHSFVTPPASQNHSTRRMIYYRTKIKVQWLRLTHMTAKYK